MPHKFQESILPDKVLAGPLQLRHPSWFVPAIQAVASTTHEELTLSHSPLKDFASVVGKPRVAAWKMHRHADFKQNLPCMIDFACQWQVATKRAEHQQLLVDQLDLAGLHNAQLAPVVSQPVSLLTWVRPPGWCWPRRLHVLANCSHSLSFHVAHSRLRSDCEDNGRLVVRSWVDTEGQCAQFVQATCIRCCRLYTIRIVSRQQHEVLAIARADSTASYIIWFVPLIQLRTLPDCTLHKKFRFELMYS